MAEIDLIKFGRSCENVDNTHDMVKIMSRQQEAIETEQIKQGKQILKLEERNDNIKDNYKRVGWFATLVGILVTTWKAFF